MIGQLGEGVGVKLAAPAEARTVIANEIGTAKQRVEIFLSGWRIKEMLTFGPARQGAPGVGPAGFAQDRFGAEQAMNQESRIMSLVRELAGDGLLVEIGAFSGQEAGLLIDRKMLWLLPAGGFGQAADTLAFMRAELPQFGLRVVSAWREGCKPWAGARAVKAA